MFQSVRHWWGSGRGKVSARLFAFEFVVVVLGVLVAQGLANWVSERGVRQEAVKEEARVRYEIGRVRQFARVWRTAIPCLRQRVDLMLRAAETGQPRFSEADLAVPRFGFYSVEPLSADMERPLRTLVGANRSDEYGGIIGVSDAVRGRIAELREDWMKFGLLALPGGPLEPGELAALRSATVRIRNNLASIAWNHQVIDEYGAQLGIAPIASREEMAITELPVANCAEIWRNHDIARHPDR